MKQQVAIGCAIVFLAIGIISGIHGMLAYSFLSLLLLTLFLSTAFPLARFIFGSGLRAWVFVFPIGFMVHGLALSILGLFFGIRTTVLLGYMSATALLSWALRKRGDAPSEFNAIDVRWLFVWIIAALAVTSAAFFNVGRWSPEGFAYRAYFNADFFRNLAVAGSLSNTGIPPDNPYVSGQSLSYYWLFHSFFAYWKGLFPWYRPDYMLVQFSMVAVCICVSSFFIAVRSYVTSQKALALLLLLLLFGGSYKGMYILWKLHDQGLNLHTFTTMNVEGILRWDWRTPQIDMLYRAFLYAPQHLIALSSLFLLLTVWASPSTRAGRLAVYAVQLASVGFSLFIGGVLALFTAAVLLSRAMVRWRESRLELLLYGFFAAFALALYVLVFRMFPLESSALVRFGLDNAIRNHLLGYAFLNWGAVLPLALAGLIWRPAGFPFRFLGFFLVVSVLLIYCVELNLPGVSDISLKLGYLSSILLLFFAAGFLERIFTQPKRYRQWIAVVPVLLLLIPAAATWSMEEFNSRDIANKQFTTFIQADDWAALEWMRDELPHNAVVQYYPAGKGYLNEFVTEVPPLAERGVFLGDKNFTRLFQTPQAILDLRAGILWNLFNDESPAQIYEICRAQGIDIIYLSSRAYDAAFDFRQELIEPYFTVIHQTGKAIVVSRNDGIDVRAEDVGQTVLKEEKHKPVLRATYGRNLYPRESAIGVGAARWMSNRAEISLNAEKPMSGKLEFSALSFVRERNLEVYLNGERLHQQAVSPKGSMISVPVSLNEGANMLRLDCLEEPERADVYLRNGDGRRVSIRFYRLRFAESSATASTAAAAASE